MFCFGAESHPINIFINFCVLKCQVNFSCYRSSLQSASPLPGKDLSGKTSLMNLHKFILIIVNLFNGNHDGADLNYSFNLPLVENSQLF